jgi:hypothetical protein
LKYRAQLRGFDLAQLEQIIRHSGERYRDTETGRIIAVGRHGRRLVMIAYEIEGAVATPVTVHAINRQQIRFRVQTGRFVNE